MEQPNFSYIDQLSRGDDVFKQKLLDIIKIEFPEEKAIYLKNIESRKFKEAAENVHKLKHKISILGLEKSYVVATNFENNLIESSDLGREEFEDVLEVMTNFLSKL
ncbi:Hpt domain-containing protein [Algibacter mikhailovii]|uniref:Histidine kinase n=1 Tax=Algibacter mikhailovii TaxID=425498 RepID=A0A918RAY8_9FLAO|nr:Hpt domain-containing protein [Algibacter mikhailovii]GGZ93213.1 histidine kinase [Algibacter mikhailovii]